MTYTPATQLAPPGGGDAQRKPSQANDQPPTAAARDALYAFNQDEVFAHDTSTMRPSSARLTVAVPMRPTSARTNRPQTVAMHVPPSATEPSLSSRCGPQERDAALAEAIKSAARQRASPVRQPSPTRSAFSADGAKAPVTTATFVVAPDEEPITASMRTMDDVAGYFSALTRQQASKTPVKFVFLVRHPQHPCEPYNPYILHVVDRHAAQGSDYFVASSTGITHVTMDGQPGEVVSLSGFMREASMFQTLTKIRFFAKYLLVKLFGRWRRHIKQHLFLRTRAALAQNFFLAKPTFARGVVQAVKEAWAIRDRRLIEWKAQSRDGITRESFLQTSNDYRQAAQETFRAACDRIEHQVQELCETVTQRADVPDLATPDALHQYVLVLEEDEAREKAAKQRRDAEEGGTGAKAAVFTRSAVSSRSSQPMAASRIAREKRLRWLKAAMDDQAHLPQYIRLIDQVVVESAYLAALRSVQLLVHELQRKDEEKMLYLITALTFQPPATASVASSRNLVASAAMTMSSSPLGQSAAVAAGGNTATGITFHPSVDDYIRMYDEVCDNVKAAASSISRLPMTRQLRPFMEIVHQERGDPANMVGSATQYPSALPIKPFPFTATLSADHRMVTFNQRTSATFHQGYDDATEATRSYARARRWFTYVNQDWPMRRITFNERFEAEQKLSEAVLSPDAAPHLTTPATLSAQSTTTTMSANYGAPIGEMVRAMDPNSTSCLRAGDFSEVLRNADEGLAVVKEMVLLRRGTFIITSANVAEFISTKLRDIQSEAKQRLLAVAQLRLDRLQQIYTARIKAISDKPSNLNKFASFVVSLNGVIAEHPALERIFEALDELFETAHLYATDTTEVTARREMVIGDAASAAANASAAASRAHGDATASVTATGGGSGSRREAYEAAIITATDFKAGSMKEMARRLENEVASTNDVIYAALNVMESPILQTFTTDLANVNEFLAGVESTYANADASMRTFLDWQKLFGEPRSDTSHLDTLRLMIQAKRDLWSTVQRFLSQRNHYYTTPIAELDMTQYAKEIDEMFVVTYGQLNTRQKCDASQELLQMVKDEKQVMPTLLQLGNTAMRREHWQAILQNQARVYDPSLTLETIKQMKLLEPSCREIIAEQSAIATGEAQLGKALESIREAWETVNFNVKLYRDSRDTYILDDVSDIVLLLEEHLLSLQSCLSSRYAHGVKPRLLDWEKRLTNLASVIDEWIYVQGQWMALEFIFASEDIKKQLPAETATFHAVDADFKDLIQRAHNIKNCLLVSMEPTVLSTLQDGHRAVDEIQRKIEDFLETKRMAFGRFYFLSNDELLRILADSRDTKAVRPHLRKCFDGIKDVRFRNEPVATEIDALISAEGEHVALASGVVQAKGAVETWLALLEKAMVSSLMDHMKHAATSYRPKDRVPWMLSVNQGSPSGSTAGGVPPLPVTGIPAQCIQAVDMLRWTAEVEEAFLAMRTEPSAMSAYFDRYAAQIIEMVGVVRSALSAAQRALVGTLLVVDVHNRDAIERLVRGKVTTASDFVWTSQLRYYVDTRVDEDDDAASGYGRSVSAAMPYKVEVRHVDASFPYAFEYIGNAPRLVLTPLTDRAFLTCTSALRMHLGGAPQGPAGTGKTESVKDLGKALARQVVVFNCSDGLNTNMMSQMFAGLAQTGAWACFDEFNRIELSVLSVIAQQVLDITSAVAQGLSRMTFDGCHNIALHPNFGVFVTMNPGYAGRTELPDNLKALFRPVCMMVPDYRLIAEIMFFSEGFANARYLAGKMVQLYRLASEQLSQQSHYDFGMRAVKSILVMAGRLKRSAPPGEDENLILVQAMRDANLPKFLKDDAVLFNALVNDLYPNVPVIERRDDTLCREIVVQLESQSLVAPESFVTKVLQLCETMVTRHGVMLVGPTLSGKSTAFEILQRSLAALAPAGGSQTKTTGAHPPSSAHPHYRVTHRHVINPKSLSRDGIYGSVNATTREWADGVLASIARSVVDAANRSADRHWIVFDGPVDAIWIENLNTVLDDNKMLCLVNGERLKMPDTVTFCFEVQDLKVASLATVSRCGMVYIDEGALALGGSSSSALAAMKVEQLGGSTNQVAVRSHPVLTSAMADLSAALTAHYGLTPQGKPSCPWKLDALIAAAHRLITAHLDWPQQDAATTAKGEPSTNEIIPTSSVQHILSTVKLLGSLLILSDAKAISSGAFGASSGPLPDDAKDVALPKPTVNEETGEVTPADALLLTVVDRSETAVAAALPAKGGTELLQSMLLLQSFIWGFGGNLTADGRAVFDVRVRQLTGIAFPAVSFSSASSAAAATSHNTAAAPSWVPFVAPPLEGSVFDYYVRRGNATWVRWQHLVPQYLYLPATHYFDRVIPTTDSCATRYLATALLRGSVSWMKDGAAMHDSNPGPHQVSTRLRLTNAHVLLTGHTGVGKSVTVKALFNDDLGAEDASSNYQVTQLVFSATTTCKQVQDRLESKLRKHPSKLPGVVCLGPEQGKAMLAFIDDLNLPAVEDYGACPPLELVRQLIVQGGFHDASKCVFKDVHGVRVVAACGAPGGGRNEMTPRLTSRFTCLGVPTMNDATLHSVYRTLLAGLFSKFSGDVRAFTDRVSRATIELFRAVTARCLPTPDRSHYVFNSRDVSRAVQGLTQATPTDCRSARDLLDMWVHESARVFHDRLADEPDRLWFWNTCRSVAVKHYASSPAATADGTSTAGDLTAAAVDALVVEARHSLYCDFGNVDPDDRTYAPVSLRDHRLHEILTEKMLSYAIQFSKPMDLVLFDDAVQHLLRICRALRLPQGHVLLIGLAGTGKQSLAQLAAFVCGIDMKQIALHKNYGVNDFRDDLRDTLLQVGCERKTTAFLLTEPQLIKEQFLEDINSLLNTGEVPNLYQPEDVDRIVTSVRDAVVALGRPETINGMLSYFTTLVRNGLRIVLTLSPVGNAFRTRLRMYPSLVNCMTLDWLAPWPEVALLSVADRVLRRPPVADLVTEEQLPGLGSLFVFMHADAPKHYPKSIYTTPASFLAAINLFASLLSEQTNKLANQLGKFRSGVEKIAEANKQVHLLRQTLVEMQPKLERQSLETAAFAQDVEREQKAASQVAAVVSVEERDCAMIAADAKSIKDDCQSDLDRAMPAYLAAQEALNALNTKDIVEAKSYVTPPKKVEMVMDAVLTVLEEERGWESARRVMSRPDFIQSLKPPLFVVDNVSDKVQRRLKKFTELEDFRPEAVQSVSKACVSLCLWCRAVDNYCDILKVVQPKRERLQAAEAKLRTTMAQLETKQAELRKLEERIAHLRAQHQASIERRSALEQEMQRTQTYLSRAERLLSGLHEEGQRWAVTIDDLETTAPFTIVTSALAAGTMVYAAPVTAHIRGHMIHAWSRKASQLGMVWSSGRIFRVADVVDPVIRRHWVAKGLPSDDVSQDNATIVTKASRWPLCIDPQGQANVWLRRLYRDRGIKVLQPRDPNLMKTLENAIRVGQPVLLENMGETVDATLEPLLQKHLVKQGSRLLLRLRDTSIEYDPNFVFFMTTRMSNPHYLPDIQIKVTLVNFTVTPKGLEEQLLADVVRHERKDLEERADRLVVQVADAKGQLLQLEDKILSLLSSKASGSLLDDEDLVLTLQQSKTTSTEITESLAVALKTSEETSLAREQYRCVAQRGSLVHSAIADMGVVEGCYQTALSQFVRTFTQTLVNTTATASNVVADRCQLLIHAVTRRHLHVSTRGMFERHRVCFAFLVAAHVARGNHGGNGKHAVTEAEWRFFLQGSDRGTAAADDSSGDDDGQAGGATDGSGANFPGALADVISAAQWRDTVGLSRIMFPSAAVADTVLSSSSTRLAQVGCASGRRGSVQALAASAAPAAIAFLRSFVDEAHAWRDLLDGSAFERAALGTTGDGESSSKTTSSRRSSSFATTQPPALHERFDVTSLPAAFVALNPFQQLLVIRLLRTERLLDFAQLFVQDTLAEGVSRTSMMGARFDFNDILADSTANAPILLLLSPGADPTMHFQQFAESMGRVSGAKLAMLSLGQGQGVKAEALIAKAVRSGDWVYLQNCHVYSAWLPALETIVLEAALQHPHDEYRLWLTSAPAAQLPVLLVQYAVKATREAPTGIAGGMLDAIASAVAPSKAMQAWDNDGGGGGGLASASPSVVASDNTSMASLNSSSFAGAKPAGLAGDARLRRGVWLRFVASLLLFHSVTRERRRFGPLGWNVPYDWNTGDLDAALKAALGFVSSAAADDTGTVLSIDWDATHYMLGTICYGGRVTDDRDMMGVGAMLRRFISPVVAAMPNAQAAYWKSKDAPVLPPWQALQTVADLQCFADTFTRAPLATTCGLHSNAEATFRTWVSRSLMEAVVSAQVRGGGGAEAAPDSSSAPALGGGGSGTSSTAEVVLDLQRRVPLLIDRTSSHEETYQVVNGCVTSLGTVCMQEIDRYNILIRCVRDSLARLKLALQGLVVLDAQLEATAESLALMRVPTAWARSAYPSLKPLGAWFRDFVQRVEFFRDWNDLGVPGSFWLGGFTFPQGFLTGVIQACGRRHRLAIDELFLEASVTVASDPESPALETILDDGCYIHGLHLEGARWDSETAQIQEPLPRMVAFQMPVLKLTPVWKANAALRSETDASSVAPAVKRADGPTSNADAQGRYDCPVYKISTRAGSLSTTGVSTNFIASFHLPAATPVDAVVAPTAHVGMPEGVGEAPKGASLQDHWTLRGCALIAADD